MLKTSFLNKTPVLTKVVLFLLAMLLVFKVTAILAAEEFDFRNSTWGMTPEEIIANETGEFLEFNEEENLLIFKAKEPVYGMNAKVYYSFTKEKLLGLNANELWYCSYSLFLNEKNPQFTNKYFEIEELLSNKYGEPQKIKYWLNNKKFQNYISLEEAILANAVIVNSRWTFENYITILSITNYLDRGLTFEIVNMYQNTQIE